MAASLIKQQVFQLEVAVTKVLLKQIKDGGTYLTKLRDVHSSITSSYADIGDVRIRCRILRGHETRGC